MRRTKTPLNTIHITCMIHMYYTYYNIFHKIVFFERRDERELRDHGGCLKVTRERNISLSQKSYNFSEGQQEQNPPSALFVSIKLQLDFPNLCGAP
jgi:hypothetical protein